MNPLKIIETYYSPDSKVYNLLVPHSRLVMEKALQIAKSVPELNLDLQFVKEAALLHDIGIFLTNAEDLDCHGDKPYICHGYLGREIMEKEGYPKHALVCERHVGMGISAQDIVNQKLPLPLRDMLPLSNEEILICLADKFYSKSSQNLSDEKSIERIIMDHQKFGEDKIKRLEQWLNKFKIKQNVK